MPHPTPTLQLRSIQHVTCVPLTRNVNMPLATLTLQMRSKSKKNTSCHGRAAVGVQLHYTNYTTLQLQLKTTTPLHYNYTYSYNCTKPHYIQQLWWGDHCNHCRHSRKHNSNHLSVHQWIRSAIRDSQQPTSPIGFLFLKLPPPPCAVLPVRCYT